MLNAEYEIELLKKLPLFHRNIYEFQQISKATTPELEQLLHKIDFILDNWFIDTSDEYGISRMEKIVGIVSDSNIDLETRRFNLLLKMSEKLPYTDETLEERLTSLCGAGNYSIQRDYDNYKIDITTSLEAGDTFESMCEALDNMIPCNMDLSVSNKVIIISTGVIYTGGIRNVKEKIFVTNDISSTVRDSAKVFTGTVDKMLETIKVR